MGCADEGRLAERWATAGGLCVLPWEALTPRCWFWGPQGCPTGPPHRPGLRALWGRAQDVEGPGQGTVIGLGLSFLIHRVGTGPAL